MRNTNLKRQIRNSVVMRDGSFGISLNFQEMFPKNPAYVEHIRVDVKKGEHTILTKILLPHQLYLQDLIEMSNEGIYDVFITPLYPELKPFNVFL